MANVSLDELFPLLLPHLPGVPNATMRFHLAATAAEFLAETHLWREPMYPDTTTAGVQDYELIGDAVIESVLWLNAGDYPLSATDPRLLNLSLIHI